MEDRRTPERGRAAGRGRAAERGRAVPGADGCERGSGTLLAAAALLVAGLVAGALLVVAGYLAALHHARAAADLVALSGAATQARGGDACRTARELARQNGVRLAECRVRGDSFDFVVSTTVVQRTPGRSPLLPSELTAIAHAGRLGLLR
nr:Rv3654c family TadE-like protein [Propionicimonas sp.]